MRIFQTLLLPASEIVDFVYETIHYPFFYAFLFFLLSQPWKPEYKKPPRKDDGLPKTRKRGNYKQLLDRLATPGPLTKVQQEILLQNGGSSSAITNNEHQLYKSPNHNDNSYFKELAGKQPTTTAKANMMETVKGLKCPLCGELPSDPVTAEDGMTYERHALEEYFKAFDVAGGTHDDDGKRKLVPSPVNDDLLIGQNFLPSPQYKRIIGTLIRNGTIAGKSAERWEERQLHKEHMEDMIDMAQKGVVMEMLAVACNYLVGEGDFKEDAMVAFQWFEKAHHAGSPIGTAGIGLMLTRGVGVVAKDPQKGLDYLLVAGKGSDFAAYMLGLAYADGKLGFKVNTEEAAIWLKRCLGTACTQRHMTMEDKFMAQQKLDELMQR